MLTSNRSQLQLNAAANAASKGSFNCQTGYKKKKNCLRATYCVTCKLLEHATHSTPYTQKTHIT